jgi:hypothetical protein
MTYIAALSLVDKFKLVDFPLPTAEAAMLHGFNTFPMPESVTVVAKDQRALTAPKQEELFKLVKARLAPTKLDSEWFQGSTGMVRKIFSNVLENPNAEIICWDKEKYNTWTNEAEARWQQERKERMEADAKAKSQHGYVYTFHYCNKNIEWIKIGMTDSDNEVACWNRIKDYIKQHNLPRDGWKFVGFIACTEARELEQRLHKHMRHFRYKKGNARELFACAISIYMEALRYEGAFIDAHEPDTAGEEIERAKQEEAKRQAKAEREKAEREKAEREKAEREKAEQEKAEQEKAEQEKAEQEKRAKQKAYSESMERAKREKAEREKREQEFEIKARYGKAEATFHDACYKRERELEVRQDARRAGIKSALQIFWTAVLVTLLVIALVLPINYFSSKTVSTHIEVHHYCDDPKQRSLCGG